MSSVLGNTFSKRSYSTLTTAETPPAETPPAESPLAETPPDLPVPLSVSEDGDPAATPTVVSAPLPLPDGAKFPLPLLPIPARAHLNHRYSPLLDQVTNFLMRHGKVRSPTLPLYLHPH